MPYIDEKIRVWLEYNNNKNAEDTGQLNYLLTLTIIDYLTNKGLKYITCNDIVGALESCKLEFYDRIVRRYENLKIHKNGDVYPTLESLLEKKNA